MLLILPLLVSLFSSLVAAQDTKGSIITPTNGTIVMPNTYFNFTYETMADYGVSSRNFSVWLLTSEPATLWQGNATASFVGRYSEENYPANPYPVNPVPSQLLMPDFSQLQTGFGGSEIASNLPIQLVVVEEYTEGASVGDHLKFSSTTLIYNATTQ